MVFNTKIISGKLFNQLLIFFSFFYISINVSKLEIAYTLMLDRMRFKSASTIYCWYYLEKLLTFFASQFQHLQHRDIFPPYWSLCILNKYLMQKCLVYCRIHNGSLEILRALVATHKQMLQTVILLCHFLLFPLNCMGMN